MASEGVMLLEFHRKINFAVKMKIQTAKYINIHDIMSCLPYPPVPPVSSLAWLEKATPVARLSYLLFLPFH